MLRFIPSTTTLTALSLLFVLILPSQGQAQVDSEELAEHIANSLKANLTNPRFKTVAISRILPGKTSYNVRELIDYTNIKIVRGRRLQVVDRSKLELILTEQKIQLSDFVSANKYQQLGNLMGVDLFIYGTFYNDALVLKGIDVQNSAIVWADLFPITEESTDTLFMKSMGKGVVDSLAKDSDRLDKAKIRLVSFWSLETDTTLAPKMLMDYLSVAITKSRRFKVVDRENIRLITEEQKLNQAVFIDQKNAKRLGELYGVDAFIYGSIRRRPDGSHMASLKMMNIFNGVIEWADLIKIHPGMRAVDANLTVGRKQRATRPPGMIYVPGGPFLMGANNGPRESRPAQQITLPPYYIDETEVTNGDYLRFVTEMRYQPPRGWSNRKFPNGQSDHPVVFIAWEDARRYCTFMGKRLPTEQEWEKAARGSSGAIYPWGNSTFSPGFTITRESGRSASVPVSYPTRDLSPFRIKHMAGNVREWVQDRFDAYQGNAGLTNPKFGRERVVRGGSWATTHRRAALFMRDSSQPFHAWADVGFRCAMDANP